MPEATPAGITKVHMTDAVGETVVGTGGGAATIADGADVTQGAKADATWDGAAASASVVAILKKIYANEFVIYNVLNNSLGWLPGTAFGVGVTGQLSYGVRKDVPTTFGADGTIAPFEFDSSGKLWVNTGGLTDTQLRATPVPVSGTFWQATQPISAVSLPLPTGAATEATLALQQVAGGTAIGALKSQLASAVAATSAPSYSDGTINPLSQTLAGALRVGGTVTATGPLTDAQLRASAVPISIAAAVDVSDRAARLLGIVDKGKIWDGTNIAAVKAGVVAVAGDNPLVVTLHPSSAPTAAQPVTGTFWQATQPVSGTVSVTPPTLTKGTQGATGFSTQDLKDSGRNQTNYFHAAPIITTTGEVMQSLTGYKSGAAVGATVTPAVVTAGKTYRITRVTINYTAATVIGGALIRLRANLSGTGVVTSPLVETWQIGVPAIFTAGAMNTVVMDYPEGLEFAAGTGIAVGVIGAGAVPTTGTVTGYVQISIEGYEY